MFSCIRKLFPREHIPIVGNIYILMDADPFPSEERILATILDTRMGWVRYHLNSEYPDQRMEIKIFNLIYVPYMGNK